MKFMSDNGVIFDRMEDCEAFEKNPSFIMYDEDGKVTNDCGDAIIVHVIESNGAYLFEDLCAAQGSSSRGIDHFNDPGYYIWNGSCKYEYVPEKTYELLKKV